MSAISAFVITCDKKPEEVLHAVVKRISWADQVVIVDKGRRKIEWHLWSEAPFRKYVAINWSPIHEPDRHIALEHCIHDWIVAVDDDEILSSDCEWVFRRFVEEDKADVLEIPMHNYVLGRFSKHPAMWPEWRPVLYRRGKILYGNTLHHGIGIAEGARVLHLHEDAPIYIDHLSHANVSQFFEKTNRYTDYPDRAACGIATTDYETVVGWLKDTYNKIDALKQWEKENLPDGVEEFRRIAQEVLCG